MKVDRAGASLPFAVPPLEDKVEEKAEEQKEKAQNKVEKARREVERERLEIMEIGRASCRERV